MCLIVFSLGQHPQYPLVVAANRDEFFQRPTAAMDWWPENNLLAGRDLLSGGTWLAVRRDGAVAAVTNVRDGVPEQGALSRGELPLHALRDSELELEARLLARRDDYAGFNLVRLTPDGGWYFSNRDAHPGRRVYRGLYGLSNHLLQSPWPKLLRLRNTVGALLDSPQAANPVQLHDTLIEHLQDDTPAPDHELPDTGVGLDTERFLSSPFIRGSDYGTRATTIVTLDRGGEIRVTEQNWGPGGHAGERRQFCWQREP